MAEVTTSVKHNFPLILWVFGVQHRDGIWYILICNVNGLFSFLCILSASGVPLNQYYIRFKKLLKKYLFKEFRRTNKPLSNK